VPDQLLIEYKRKNRQRFLLIFGISILGLFCIAALLHIGAGDAKWSGMTVSNITPANAMEFNIPKDEKGVVINWCEDPAYSSGLRGGDLLKAINNKKVHSIPEFLNVTKTVNIDQGALLDILRNGQPLYITLKNAPSVHENFKKLFDLNSGAPNSNLHSSGQQIAFGNQLPAEVAEAGAVNFDTAPAASQLPSPKEQGAAQKELVEGHWLGMETIPLVPELAKEFNIPADIKGVLVDEISLESAESGVLAGDMVVAVDGFATPDLNAFTEATRRVRNKTRAKVLVSRRGQLLEFTISSTRSLGFSQNESAQPIRPGAISPHRSRGKPCTECHIIMETGGQLPIDAGDILPNPPPIIRGAVAPHEDRGKCTTCHVILKDVAQL
jgi:hypothetical protein